MSPCQVCGRAMEYDASEGGPYCPVHGNPSEQAPRKRVKGHRRRKPGGAYRVVRVKSYLRRRRR